MSRTDPALAAWEAPGSPPTAGSPAGDVLRAALDWAILAPSGHNTQPWRFHLLTSGDDVAHVELRADRSRRLPVVDPDDRALVISCGAALGFLTSVLEEWGTRPATRLMPHGDDPDLLAVVTLDVSGRTRSQGDEVTRAISARRSNRHPYDPDPLDDALVAQLVTAATAEGVLLRMVEPGDERRAVADLVAEGDRIQMHDREFRRELSEWVHHNHSPAVDGMRGQAFGIPDLVSHLGPFVVRTFDQGGRQAHRDHDLALTAPAVAVLATRSDDRRDWIMAGRALARVLLAATSAGVSAAFLNQPVEVPELRARLSSVLGLVMVPQLLFRLGHGPDVPPQPRHPLTEVLEDRTGVV
jgi:hypothetical protein